MRVTTPFLTLVVYAVSAFAWTPDPSPSDKYPGITFDIDPWPPHQCSPIRFTWTHDGLVSLMFDVYDPSLEPNSMPWLYSGSFGIVGQAESGYRWNMPYGVGAIV